MNRSGGEVEVVDEKIRPEGSGCRGGYRCDGEEDKEERRRERKERKKERKRARA
jgi:hypothetical protein